MRSQGLPLRPTLLTVVVVLILMAAGSVGFLAYRSSRNIVSQLWSGFAEQIAQNTMHRTLRYFEPAPPYVQMSERQVEDGRLSLASDGEGGLPVDLLDHFDAALSAHPEFSWASFGAADGTYVTARRLPSGEHRGLVRRIDTSGKTLMYEYQRVASGKWTPLGEPTVGDYDPRKRPWYQQAVAQQEGLWIEPFLFATTQVPGFMYVKAQRDASGAVQGVWAVEQEVSHLSGFLKDLVVGKTGQVYVVTKGGLVVGHPGGQTTASDDAGKTVVATAEGHTDRMLSKAWAGLAKQSGVGASFTSGPYLVMASPFPAETSIDWQVLVVVPENDFFSDVRSQAMVTVAVGVIAAILAALLGAIFASRVSGNMRLIAAHLDRIGQFQLDEERLELSDSLVREINEMRDTTERMKSSLRSFGKFVPQEVVRELLLSGAEAELGGEQANLTILFSDIAGFTTVAEALDVDDLVKLLGEYLEVMSGAIREQGGTVDKYIGDAIMAFWGAPKPQEDHAIGACRAAVVMQARLGELQARWRERGAPQFATRIGINTGDVVVGNMGAPDRLNYTVIGDPVNLAARLESLGKLYGVSILVGEDTAKLVSDSVSLRKLDWVAVRGKKQSVAIYELLVDSEDDTKREAAHEHYAQGLLAYRKRDFTSAANAFERCRKELGEDQASVLMIERCGEYSQEPPPEDWDGATVMTRK